MPKALDLPSVDLILMMLERITPYEMKMMIQGTVMSFPPTKKISTSLT
jgi:hypothetical protein